MSDYLKPLLISLLLWTVLKAAAVAAPADAERGRYLLQMGGCSSCHTRDGGEALAGGRSMETPFGTFITPNITPHPETGIGEWSDKDFIRAMTEGRAPDGSHYYPAFPYVSYRAMSRQDLLDLKAYLDSVEPVDAPSTEHELAFPFNIRALLGPWKWLNLNPPPDLDVRTEKSEAWMRGRYIVRGPGHCGECHTPRNLLGGLEQEAHLAGNPEGPEGESVPPITPEDPGFSRWSEADIVFALQTGMKPDGDFLGGSMGHVIENSTGKLTESDLKAIAAYLRDPEEPL
ncbi:MAG: cytochrome c [Sedimenticola sp.]|nr:cytochrome c [Sedimenticola sp.]